MKQGHSKVAIEKYHCIAREAGLPLVTMALQWCISRWSLLSATPPLPPTPSLPLCLSLALSSCVHIKC